MVTRRDCRRDSSGVMLIEAMVGLAILILAVLPMSMWLMRDTRSFRDTYYRAVAMEIVDGEMEILAAGDWRNYPEGTNVYRARAEAAANLPPGEFQVIRHGEHLRLEWATARKSGIGSVAREAVVK